MKRDRFLQKKWRKSFFLFSAFVLTNTNKWVIVLKEKIKLYF